MEDERRYLEDNRKLWDEWTRIHTRGEFYDVEGFRRGDIRIEPWEQEEVGDVHGKTLLHLQCHFGLDTLSWARLGATVTGVDFSEPAITFARSLAEEIGVPDAHFLLSSVYDLPDLLEDEFDVVYTSRGSIGWLPSIERWADVIVRYVAPGGSFYMHEGHPFLWTVSDDQKVSNPIELAYDYWEGEVISSPVQGSYADPDAEVQAEADHGWNHGLGEVVTALAARGLHLEFLHEHRFVGWPVPWLVEAGEGRYTWPEHQAGTMPLTYSLKASKPAG